MSSKKKIPTSHPSDKKISDILDIYDLDDWAEDAIKRQLENIAEATRLLDVMMRPLAPGHSVHVDLTKVRKLINAS